MAAVLRSAARRLAGELPAAEMGLHRLPLHSQTKAVIESTLLPQLIPRRTMSSSSGRAASQPADKVTNMMPMLNCMMWFWCWLAVFGLTACIFKT
uniref:Uncharacterized protein n=1 Tax=Aegilops tauschii subsp. strangulata TaxID=200361 RepID=A0A452ZJX9_AEGTS